MCQHGASCDHVSGACLCAPGWRGNTCNRPCPDGFYGQDCHNTCQCNEAGSASCDHVTGVCEICPSGRRGVGCLEICDPGTWGPECSQVGALRVITWLWKNAWNQASLRYVNSIMNTGVWWVTPVYTGEWVCILALASQYGGTLACNKLVT